MVPQKALIIDKGGAYIFVVRPDSVCEQRFIELGPEIGNSVIVERGLAADEQIIVEGYHKLVHGTKVQLVPVPGDSTSAETLPSSGLTDTNTGIGPDSTQVSSGSCQKKNADSLRPPFKDTGRDSRPIPGTMATQGIQQDSNPNLD